MSTMTEGQKKYNAFISYRHLPVDLAVAEKLQNLLENYRPPKGVQTRYNRIDRLFRDTTELPTSSSLGNAIEDALLDSEYLIVILSEETKNSRYCMEEIDFFKSQHGGKTDHILPVIADGDPKQCLPENLCFEEREETSPDGTVRTVRKEIEPIFCDVRPDADRSRMQKLKTEYLRIAAPLLGCGYDDLYQRQRRRARRRTGILASVAAAVVAGYLLIIGYNYVQIRQKNEALEIANITLREQKQELQINESRLLTESAQQDLAEQNYQQALIKAASALPQDENDDRPFYAPAEALLWKILGEPQDVIISAELQHSNPVSDYCISRDGLRCYSVDEAFTVRCFNLKTKTLEWSANLPLLPTPLVEHDFVLSEKNGLVYVSGALNDPDATGTKCGVCAVNIASGELEWMFDEFSSDNGMLALSPDESQLVFQEQNKVIGDSYNHCIFIDPQTGKPEQYYSPGQQFQMYKAKFRFPDSSEGVFDEKESSRYAGVYYEENGSAHYRHFFTIDRDADCWQDVYVDRIPEWLRVRFMKYDSSTDSLYLVCDSRDLYCAAELMCINTSSGELKWSAAAPLIDASVYGEDPYWLIHPISVCCDESRDILLVGRRQKVYVFDMTTGALIGENVDTDGHPGLLGEDVQLIDQVNDGVYGVILRNGESRLGRMTDSGFHDQKARDVSKSKLIQCRIWNNGLNTGTLTEKYIDPQPAEGFVLTCSDADSRMLTASAWYRLGADWNRSEIFSCQDREYFANLSSGNPVISTDGSLQFLTYRYGSASNKQYTFHDYDITGGQMKRFDFETKKDLTDHGGVFVLPDGHGLIIDDGYGSILLYDQEKDEMQLLAGNTDAADAWNGKRNDAQGASSAKGQYVTTNRRSQDGSVISAVCDENSRMHIWYNGIAQPDVALPKNAVWHQNIEYTSYRDFIVGSNGYIVISDFSKAGSSNTLTGFQVYSTWDRKWISMEDESGGRADRLVAVGNRLPLIAVEDSDQTIALKSITDRKSTVQVQLPLPASFVRKIGFSQDDQFFFAVTQSSDAHLYVYRTDSGEPVYDNQYTTSTLQDPVSLLVDGEQERLYVLSGSITSGSNINCYCIDMRSWNPVASVKNAIGIAPDHNRILIRYLTTLRIQDIPTAETLIPLAVSTAEELNTYWKNASLPDSDSG